MIEKIKNQLSLLTQGMSTGDKLKYLKGLGYDSFNELAASSEGELTTLLKYLKKDQDNDYETIELKGNLSGYTVTRPKILNKKTKVSDMSFKYRGLNI